MKLTFGEKVKIILRRRNATVTDLANMLGTSPQNLTNKFTRDNFSEKDMHEIAKCLNCTYSTNLRMNDTGEEI